MLDQVNNIFFIFLRTQVLFPVLISKRSHWILIVLDLNDWQVVGYDSFERLCKDTPDDRNIIVEELGDNIVRFLDAIGFWRKSGRQRELGDTTEFRLNLLDDVPQQVGPLGDCGVWVCRNMETHVNRTERKVTEDRRLFALKYRKRMMDTFFRARFDWQPPSPTTS